MDPAVAARAGSQVLRLWRRRLKLESGVGKRKMEVRDVETVTQESSISLRHMCIQTGDGGAPLFFKWNRLTTQPRVRLHRTTCGFETFVCCHMIAIIVTVSASIQPRNYRLSVTGVIKIWSLPKFDDWDVILLSVFIAPCQSLQLISVPGSLSLDPVVESWFMGRRESIDHGMRGTREGHPENSET